MGKPHGLPIPYWLTLWCQPDNWDYFPSRRFRRGRIMRRHAAGDGAAPASVVRKPRPRAASGLRPGPLRVPARSWLTIRAGTRNESAESQVGYSRLAHYSNPISGKPEIRCSSENAARNQACADCVNLSARSAARRPHRESDAATVKADAPRGAPPPLRIRPERPAQG